MVHAPVGVKCRDCARMPRSALVRLKPAKARAGHRARRPAPPSRSASRWPRSTAPASASSASSSRSASGCVMAEVVTRTSGYYRGRESGLIAGGASMLAYVVAWQAVPILVRAPRLATELDHAAVRVRPRRGRRRLPAGLVSGGGSRLRRARRVVAGGLVGGAVVLLAAGAGGASRSRSAGSDPLAAFTTRPATARRSAAGRPGHFDLGFPPWLGRSPARSTRPTTTLSHRHHSG